MEYILISSHSIKKTKKKKPHFCHVLGCLLLTAMWTGDFRDPLTRERKTILRYMLLRSIIGNYEIRYLNCANARGF